MQVSNNQEPPCQNCQNCQSLLCLRQKVINLALGNTEIMYCFLCLAKKEHKTPEHLLAKIKPYILSRECFRKEWLKYKDTSDCSVPKNCFPGICSEENNGDSIPGN